MLYRREEREEGVKREGEEENEKKRKNILQLNGRCACIYIHVYLYKIHPASFPDNHPAALNAHMGTMYKHMWYTHTYTLYITMTPHHTIAS